MSETPGDYIRTHKLPVKYGFGVIAFALMICASVINGDPASLIGLKALAAIPIAISWICIAQLYGELSNQPFTPSFIERTLLEGVTIIAAVGIASWEPDRQPLGMFVSAVFGIALYFAIRSAAYLFIARRK